MALSLDTFSTEILLKIFRYLDTCDLCRLKQTCKRFNEIVTKWDNYLIKEARPLVTNQAHATILNRSYRLLTPFERMRISTNWRRGIYREKSLLHSKIKYVPWLQLEKDLLWVSRGGSIRAYKRNNRGIYTNKVVHTIKASRPNQAEVCRFVKKGNFVVSGQTDRGIWLWSVEGEKFIYDLIVCHDAEVSAVDLSDDVVVSGSKDHWVKFWSRRESDLQRETHPSLMNKIDFRDRIWSVALAEENKSLLAVGTAGIEYNSTVNVFDMNREMFLIKFNSNLWGAGVLDMKWENASVLWSCGYDNNVRRWDLRTGKCEQILSDPCGATIYCFQYDYCNTVMSGTYTNGRVVLWDTRQDNYVQMYFMGCCERRDKSSPVYSLSFDAEFLYTVTDQHVNVLDFSLFSNNSRDYGNLFLKLVKV